MNSPTDEDLWGNELNNNMDIIDSTLHSLSGGGFTLPSGVMLPFAGASVPVGYLGCDGSAVSRVTYAALFTAIGTTWGVGDGVSTFNLPNMQRKTAVGSGGTGTGTLGNAVGSTGGEENHALTIGEGPTHSHTVTDPGHVHPLGFSVYSNAVWGNNSAGPRPAGTFDSNTSGTVSGNTSSAATGISLANSGSGTAHNTMQPSAVVLYIIKQ